MIVCMDSSMYTYATSVFPIRWGDVLGNSFREIRLYVAMAGDSSLLAIIHRQRRVLSSERLRWWW